MNHKRQYHLLIENAVNRGSVDGYFERHHILPRALGGGDESTNLVALTAREHFVAHCLLAKIHGGTQWLAIIRMKKNKYCNSRLYENAKKEWNAYNRGENNPFYGKKHTPETIAKMSGENHFMFGKKQSAETVAKRTGKNNHMYGKSGKDNPMFGRKHSPETIAKMSAKKLGNKYRLGILGK